MIKILEGRRIKIENPQKSKVKVSSSQTVTSLRSSASDSVLALPPGRIYSPAEDLLISGEFPQLDYEDPKTVQTSINLILKPFTDTTNPRLAQGRAELVDQLISRTPPLSET